MSLNKATLIGRLGKEPDVRHLDNGRAVANISLATDEKYTDKQSGELVSKTEWHNVKLWTPLAELAEKYLHKGRQVYIEGKIETRSYDDKDGVKRFVTEIVGNKLVFLGDKNTQVEVKDNKPEPVTINSGDDLPF